MPDKSKRPSYDGLCHFAQEFQDFLSWNSSRNPMNPHKYMSQKAISNTPALGVVFSGDASFGQGVEKGGFAHIGQTYDAAFEAHGGTFGDSGDRPGF